MHFMEWPKGAVTTGVGLIATYKDEGDIRVLMLTELKEKPELGKVSGMRSFPMETTEKGETPKDALHRLIAQEVPGLGRHLRYMDDPIGLYQVQPDIWLQVVGAICDRLYLPTLGTFDPEVRDHSWDALEEVHDLPPEKLRQGAWEGIDDFFLHGRNRVCMRCRNPLHDSVKA